MSNKKQWNRLFYFIFSLAVTVGIFSYLLAHVSFRDVLTLIRDADKRGIMMFLVLSISMSFFRTWRYKILLKSSGYSPGSFALFLVVIVRNFFSDLLPARVGSLVYVYIVTTRLGVPLSASLSSFTLAFLLDIVALAPMVILAALHVGVVAGFSRGYLILGGAILAALTVALLFLLPLVFKLAASFFRKVTLIKESRRGKLCESLSNAAAQIRKAKQDGIYLRLFVLSILVRVTKYAGLYVFLFALIGPLGYGFAKLSISRVFIGLCSAELAACLPVSGIAGFGAYEGTWALVFGLLGFPGGIARLTSISHHLFTQVYGYLLGVVALLILLLPFFKGYIQPRGAAFSTASVFTFYGKVAAITGLVALALIGFYLLG